MTDRNAWTSDGTAWPPCDEAAFARPVLAAVAEMAARHADRVAIEDDARAITFRGLWGLVGAIARAIRASGAAPGPVAILSRAEIAYVPALLACIAAGRPCVLLDAAVPPQRNDELIRQVGPTLLLEHPDGSGVAAEGVVRLPLDPGMAPGDGPDLAGSLGADAPAVILCTSGSSGAPKAIVLSQRALAFRSWMYAAAIGLAPGDLCLTLFRPSAMGGFMAQFTAALTGSSARFLDLRESGIAGLLDTLAARPVTVIRAGPSALRLVAALPQARAALARVRNVSLYAEPVRPADVASLRACLPPGATIFAGYSSTEAPGMGWHFSGGPHDDAGGRTPAGRLPPGVQAMLAGDDGRPVAAGEAGELVLRSRYNALGEWRDGALSPGALQPDPADPAQRIHRTGDLARRTPDGVFTVLGRIDRMLKVNGQRIEPAEIEAAIRRAAEVADCAVVAQARGAATALVAHVVLRPGVAAAALDGVRAGLRGVLPAAMVPSRLVAIDALPLLSGGKVDYVRLTGGQA